VPAALIKIVTATLINQQKAHKKCQFPAKLSGSNSYEDDELSSLIQGVGNIFPSATILMPPSQISCDIRILT